LLSPLERRLAEPLLEADLAELRVVARNQRALAEFGPEVPRVRVDDNLAGVVARGKALTDQLIETELLGTGHFNRAIQRRGLGDVISGHGLNEYRWQANRRPLSGVIGDARDELEELRVLHPAALPSCSYRRPWPTTPIWMERGAPFSRVPGPSLRRRCRSSPPSFKRLRLRETRQRRWQPRG
jgi:hypothetical protein